MKVKHEVQEAADLLGIKGKLKKEQIEPINRILKGKDTVVIYPTGFGKSAIMQIPALANNRRPTLVIEPTVSLMFDQAQTLQALGIAAEYISHRNVKQHTDILDRYESGGIAILYIAPERLYDPDFLCAIRKNPPWLVCIDEAHCVLDWGTTFRPDYLIIGDFLDSLEQRPTVLAMTATLPEDCRPKLAKALCVKKPAFFTASLNRPNLTLIRENMKSAKDKSRCRRIKTLIDKYGSDGRVVVYCATKHDTDMAFNYLKEKYPRQVVECHAFMDDEDRERAEWRFLAGERRIMVATTAFGMGVDVPDIRLIVHYSLPISPISWYQEFGRAGRDGGKARCVLMYHPDDRKKFSRILKEVDGKQSRKQLEHGIDQMEAIAAGDTCLMEAVLELLGEKALTPCGRCSVCQAKRRA